MEELASKKRRGVGVYVDYLLFAAVAAPVQWIAQSRGVQLHWAVVFFAFALVESSLIKKLGSSAGYWALGIVRREGAPVVEASIKRRERWWTMALGVGLILKGAKDVVRWTEGLPPLPVFGSGADVGAFLVVSALGAGNVGAGLAILRCRSVGAFMGMAVFVLEAGVLALSWSGIEGWIAARLSIRSELRGRGPVTAEQIAEFQGIFYVTLGVGMILTAVALVFTYLRFRRESVAARGTPLSLG